MNNRPTMSDKLCLKWSDFQENITTSFDGLRNDTDFSDVTLACEDGEQFEAHKVILAASSPFFQNLLRKNKDPHPMIYLKGVKSDDLVAIIDFLYCGEVNIFQANLEVFMATAEELKIKGLVGSIGENEKEKLFNNSITGKKKTKMPPKNIETESFDNYFKAEVFEEKPNMEAPAKTISRIFFASSDIQELKVEMKSMMKNLKTLSTGKRQISALFVERREQLPTSWTT